MAVNAGHDEEIESWLATVERYQPGVRERFATRSTMDPAFAYSWLRYAGRLLGRGVLTPRQRFFVMTGQYTMSRRYERLRETLVGAFRAEVDPVEVREVIFQCAIYGGDSIVDEPLRIFAEEIERVGLSDQLTGLGIDERSARRDQAEERTRWHPADAADPRADRLVERFGWEGISMALVLRPQHTVNNAEFISGLDEEFAQAFYDLGYSDSYGRLVLDHATRLLCMVGNTLAIGETVQTKHHMRGAIRQGASPREVLEVLFQTVVTVGHPNVVPERFKDLVAIVQEEGASF